MRVEFHGTAAEPRLIVLHSERAKERATNMANNRLLLVYRPTGRAVVLGKRIGSGWYLHSNLNLADRLKELFDGAESSWEDGSLQDDFELVIEDSEQAPKLSEDWKYGGSYPLHIIRKE